MDGRSEQGRETHAGEVRDEHGQVQMTHSVHGHRQLAPCQAMQRRRRVDGDVVQGRRGEAETAESVGQRHEAQVRKASQGKHLRGGTVVERSHRTPKWTMFRMDNATTEFGW